MKIAIIDTIGLTYDGTTLSKRGLGGSESAVILISENLAKLGHEVDVFNNCIDVDSSPGIHNDVKYIDHSEYKFDKEKHIYDIAISSRTVLPFFASHKYAELLMSAKKRILWMHDTFCEGDHHVEEMIMKGFIDEIFTLSDFHSWYVTSCDHGNKRNFEVLKHKFWQTRNGAVRHIDEVDIFKKDRNHFVYNASATKGLIPLVTRIWPEIKKVIPEAHLTCIGGYYRFRTGSEPDEQEKMVNALIESAPEGVTFTGVIPQYKIAEILSNASLMLYPTAFPETFGISSLESLLYNTPIVTNTFGALEETAIDKACYKIPYSSTNNALFKNINEDEQAMTFVQTVQTAYNNTYLHYQKQNYCDVVKDIAGWDTVALQWDQHFHTLLDESYPSGKYRAVSRINDKVSRIFGRRFNNVEDRRVYKSYGPQRRIIVISPFRNAGDYVLNNIRSVAQQDYDNYLHILIDDNSDNRYDFAELMQTMIPSIREKTILRTNDKTLGAIRNQLNAIDDFVKEDDIVMFLDGDDWLVNNNTIFHYYNDLYSQGYDFTYGSMWSIADDIPLIAQEWKPGSKYPWKIPYTHLRTMSGTIAKSVKRENYIVDGKWMMAGADNPFFRETISYARNPIAVKEIMVKYNDLNPLNDYKVNPVEQHRNSEIRLPNEAEKFTVVIPTMWKANRIFLPFLKELIECDSVGEIIIINNDNTNTPKSAAIYHSKVQMLDYGKNIYVNPAWNIGVEKSKNKKICILNDDMSFDLKLFDKVYDYVSPANGVIGLSPGVSDFNQPKHTDGSITIQKWNGEHTYGFGCLMFVHRDNWTPIPSGLDIYYGDNFIFDNFLRNGMQNYIITNINHASRFAQTTSDKSITDGFLEREREIYNNLMERVKPIMSSEKKKILIAIPTNKYIEPETFKSVYDLEVPEGYETEFQFFYGYQVDQIRNLIADWAKYYSLLFCIDSDIILPKDALVKMILADKDIISGLYIQRIPNTHVLELYEDNGVGGVKNIDYAKIQDKGIVPISACGFGCVLINCDVIRNMEYPHFVYTSAIDHKNTISEDVYFCKKAASLGYTLWADTSIKCDHIGSTKFKVIDTIQPPKVTKSHLDEIHELDMLPADHIKYLNEIQSEAPSVIYDIGACVGHWTREAHKVWPSAKIYMFDATDTVAKYLRNYADQFESGCFIGPLTDTDYKRIEFYQNDEDPGGNSYYKENTDAYDERHLKVKTGFTLDSVIEANNWPLPDMIKMDVQGAEMDILKGAIRTLQKCDNIILEAQHENYNEGAPKANEVIEFMKEIGYELVKQFTNGDVDADYHFKRYK